MTTTQRVESILEHSRQARNSDIALQIIYLQKAGMNLSPTQIEVYKTLPAMQTVCRIRRELQAEGKYPADKEVEEERYRKFKNVRENIKIEDPEKLLEAQGYTIFPYGE